MLPRMPQAVIFDMDGLLIESEVLYRDSFLLAVEEGGHPMAANAYERMFGSTWAMITTMIMDEYGPDFPLDSFREAWLRHLAVLMADGVKLKPGVIELLDLLDELGIARAIATSAGHDGVKRHIGSKDLIKRFDHIVARGDYAEPKPSPLPYLTASERLGIDPSLCLALEDSYHGVHSASSAGMMTIMVPDILQPTNAVRERCIWVAESLNEVSHLLQKAYDRQSASLLRNNN
jgi:HAD superfamily hydrolase (TIGR01509 family)